MKGLCGYNPATEVEIWDYYNRRYKLQCSEDIPPCGLVSVYQISGELASSLFRVSYSYRQRAPYFGFPEDTYRIPHNFGKYMIEAALRLRKESTGSSYSQVEASWNVMAHVQKPDFIFRRNGRFHLNRLRGGVSSVDYWQQECAPSAVVMLDTPWKMVSSQTQLCHMRCIWLYNEQLHVSACTGHLHVVLGELKILL